MHGKLKSETTHQDSLETLDLLRIMTGILRRFAGVEDRDLDQGINDTLAAIGNHVQVDRCYLFIVSESGTSVTNTHEWCAEGIDPEIDQLQDLPFETIKWWQPRLEAGESIYIPRVQNLPDNRQAERELLDAQAIQSLLVVPLMGPDQLRGFLGFDSVRHQRDWSTEARILLRAVADIFVGAMARRDALTRLLERDRQFSALIQHSSDVLMVLDHRNCFTYLSPTASRLMGLTDASAIDHSLLDYVHPSDRTSVSSALSTTHHGDIEALPDFRLKRHSGSWTWLMGKARDLSDDPAVGGIVLNAQDINDRKEAEHSLQRQATHDALTGLPNRSLLGELLNHEIGRCQRNGDLIGVMFIDLDHFKLINDGQGHRVGDELLISVAERLLGELRQADTIARFGGDEFVAILNAPPGEEKALADAAERLLSVFDQPFEIAGVSRVVTASAGLAINAGDVTAEKVIGNADAAMYLAKERGRSRLQYFDETLRDELLERTELENDLTSACELRQFRLHYQPIFKTTPQRLAGFEALLRWEHPERGLVMPDQFIPASEQSGLIVELGAWALNQATMQLRAWVDQHPKASLCMSVNLSPVQLCDPTFPDLVQSALDRYDLPASSLCLEVTETALMEQRERSIEALQRLRDLGVLLAIDDFGTGHSSLAYLRDLPVHALKIEKSFVQDMEGQSSDYSIATAIQILADEYGLKTIAEGVETESQEMAVKALGCDMLQGYGLGRPIPADQAETLIQNTDSRD